MSKERRGNFAKRVNSFFFPDDNRQYKAALCTALFASVISVSSFSNAAQIVDPSEPQQDGRNRADPDAIYTNCTDRKFEVAMEKIEGSEKSGVHRFPVTDSGGQEVVKCKLGNHLIQSNLENSGSGGQGTCGAVNYITALVSIDTKRVFFSPFVNSCTRGGGLSGLRIEAYSDQLRYITVCGYWDTTEHVGSDQIDAKTYNCTQYDLKDVIQKNHPLGTGPNYITPD
ncbi:hypothetical protein [Pseudomonas sp. SCB32]|uniref:hypothetical protein n=1 Tax=Pseudomonas sp. SCB32 TaxID=2653853 RepID=UPI00126440CB|nr:hypothetical protein [Pseudomonas sp. SCB32]